MDEIDAVCPSVIEDETNGGRCGMGLQRVRPFGFFGTVLQVRCASAEGGRCEVPTAATCTDVEVHACQRDPSIGSPVAPAPESTVKIARAECMEHTHKSL